MAKAMRICRVCGKEYEYCKTWLNTDKFRWQDVACSPECGATYFARIEASRAEKPVEEKIEQPQKTAVTTPKKKSYKQKKANIVESEKDFAEIDE